MSASDGAHRWMQAAGLCAVAERERMAIASRDVDDFAPIAVPLVNPWLGP